MIASALGGYDGVTVGWEKIGVDIPSSVNLLALRGAPALQGALLVPLMFSTARALGLSTPASLVVACGVLLDGCFLVESRLVLTDATLLLCLVLQIWGCAAAAVCASRGLQPQDSQRSLRTPTSGPRVGAGAPAALEAVDAAHGGRRAGRRRRRLHQVDGRERPRDGGAAHGGAAAARPGARLARL